MRLSSLICVLMFSFGSTANKFKVIPSRLSMSLSSKSKIVVHVRGNVKSEDIPKFYGQTVSNARNSILELGIDRFDVLSGADKPGDFLLIEAYNSESGPNDHKLTNHYLQWRDSVAPLMTQPRSAIKYRPLYPPAPAWATPAAASTLTDNYDGASISDTLTSVYSVTLTKNAFTQTVHIGDKKKFCSLFTVVVDIEILPGKEAEFIEATIINCKQSLLEPGIHRFDFMQENDNSCRFCLVEAYNAADAPAAHKSTPHYKTWAATVEQLMARPRQSTKWGSVFPAPLYWHGSSWLSHPGEGASGVTGESEYVAGKRGLSAVAGGNFGFLSPRIVMGRNVAAAALKSAIKELKISKPFIVTGSKGYSRYADLLTAALQNQLNPAAKYAVKGEPTVEDAENATRIAVQYSCDGVIAIGGGSAMDLGKAVAALVSNPGDIYDHMEVIGKGLPLKDKALPLIAIPTTSGTGAEATKNAVLKSLLHGRKASIRHESMMPSVAIVDPTLTISCPADTTAHVGLDTLCQLIEPYTSNVANPFTDALAREGIVRAARSLRNVVANGQDIEAREDMSVASVMGGLCLANARLGAVHGFAGVLGGMFEEAPHGAICAALLPHVMKKNVEKLSNLANSGNSEALIRLGRYREVAQLITGNAQATVQQGVEWVESLVRDLDVPPVGALCGMQISQVRDVCEATAVASSTKGNPVVLELAELEEIITKAL